MTRGDIIEFKRQGFVSALLGGFLKLFERDWDGWGWHLAIAWEAAHDGWFILEARHGVEINYFPNRFLKENTRFYRWLSVPPTMRKMNKFLSEHAGKSYDVTVYFWTALQYLIRHYFNHRIPRLLDDKFTCWELVFEFCDIMGKPVSSKYDCPILIDFIKAVRKG